MTKRLTLEQTLNCLKLWREYGDMEAQTLLVVSNIGLVKIIAAKYLNRGLTFEELESVGYEAIVRAINKFDYRNRSIQGFSTYLSSAIENTIRREFDIFNKHSHVLSFEEPVYRNKHGEELKIEQMIGTDSEELIGDVVDDMKIDAVRNALKCLTSRERQVILLRYGLYTKYGKTLEEVGIILDITRERVRQIEDRALTKMRHPRNTRKLKDYHND